MMRWVFGGLPINLFFAYLNFVCCLTLAGLLIGAIATAFVSTAGFTDDPSIALNLLPHPVLGALIIMMAAIGLPTGWMWADDIKAWGARKSKWLRRFAKTFDFGKGGSSAFAGMLEDWGHRYTPGAVLLGKSTFDPFWKVGWADDRGFLTIAGSRAGKGRSAIIPNLITWPGSALVIDPKGTNAAVTAARRGKGGGRVTKFLGQEVHVVDPFGIVPGVASAHFNPLAAIDPDSAHFAEEIGLLADALIVQERDGDASHWDESAKIMLAGLVAHAVTNWKGATLNDIRAVLTSDEAARDKIFAHMAKQGGIAGTAAALVLGAGPNERGSFITTALRNTQWLESDVMKDTLGQSDFDVRDIKKKSMTVYVVLPPEYLEEHKRFMRLFINLAIRGISSGKKPQYPVLFLLDEFYSLGRLTLKIGRAHV